MNIIAATEKGSLTMCKYYYDEFCVNDKCPYCADYCPVTEYPEICKYAEVGADNGK